MSNLSSAINAVPEVAPAHVVDALQGMEEGIKAAIANGKVEQA
ncbi:hypothetical protein [Paraburkholderia fungorum]